MSETRRSIYDKAVQILEQQRSLGPPLRGPIFPNLQNIPIVTPGGTALRNTFSSFFDFSLLSADYTEVENRIYQDVHTQHCCKIHGCKYGDDDSCTVQTSKLRGQTGHCQTCFDQSRG